MGRKNSLARRRQGGITTADEELERYYREESTSRGGLFTPGGATAGGIFGDGPVVVQDHDAPSAHRAAAALGAVRAASGSSEDELRRELRASRKINQRLLKLLEQKEQKQLRGRRARAEDLEDDLDEDDLDDEDLDDDEY